MGVSLVDVDEVIVVVRAVVWLWFDDTLLFFCWRWKMEGGMDWQDSSESVELEDVEQLSFFVQWCCVCLRILGFGDDADGSFLEAMEWLKVSGVWLVGAQMVIP